MQHAGLQYGQGAANSHQSPPFAHADISQTNGGNTTSSLRQFRKKDGADKNSSTDLNTSIENSHIARVPPHNHYPARPNDYYRYHQPQYPDYSSPYKETPPAQVKYSEIAETPPQAIQHVDHIQKHKEVHKDFMDMCNISQQTHMKQNYPDNLSRQQSYPPDAASVHHQYLHKEPQVHPGYKPESQYQQYPQIPKYNMPSQCRKYPPPPPENDFLAKLQQINPSMARSIMSDHHIRESQATYPTMDQNRMYPQNQRYYRPTHLQNNISYNYQPYNYPSSCNYKHPEYTRSNQMGVSGGQYPALNSHSERSISPRNLHMMNYGTSPQKISPNYSQYTPPEYAQHYQHRRPSIPQDYYQQACRPNPYIPTHQISPEPSDNRGAGSGLRHFIENWAEEEGAAEITPIFKENIRISNNETSNEPVFVINSSDISQCLENVSLVPSENVQFIIKAGALDNPVVNIKGTPETNGERTVNLHIVEESAKSDCMLAEETDKTTTDEPAPVPYQENQNEKDCDEATKNSQPEETEKEPEQSEETHSKTDEISAETSVIVSNEISVIKDMPLIDEDHAKNHAEKEEKSDEPVPQQTIDDTIKEDEEEKDEDKEVPEEAASNKRTQRIFSVDDIMNNIGSSPTETRRNSLQSVPKTDEETCDKEKEDNEDAGEETEYRQAISINEDSVIIEIGGAWVQLNINHFNGTKVLSVLPLSDSLVIDVNGNYKESEESEEILTKEDEKTLEDEENPADEKEECVEMETTEEVNNNVNEDLEDISADVCQSEIIIGEESLDNEVFLELNMEEMKQEDKEVQKEAVKEPDVQDKPVRKPEVLETQEVKKPEDVVEKSKEIEDEVVNKIEESPLVEEAKKTCKEVEEDDSKKKPKETENRKREDKRRSRDSDERKKSSSRKRSRSDEKRESDDRSKPRKTQKIEEDLKSVKREKRECSEDTKKRDSSASKKSDKKVSEDEPKKKEKLEPRETKPEKKATQVFVVSEEKKEVLKQEKKEKKEEDIKSKEEALKLATKDKKLVEETKEDVSKQKKEKKVEIEEKEIAKKNEEVKSTLESDVVKRPKKLTPQSSLDEEPKDLVKRMKKLALPSSLDEEPKDLVKRTKKLTPQSSIDEEPKPKPVEECLEALKSPEIKKDEEIPLKEAPPPGNTDVVLLAEEMITLKQLEENKEVEKLPTKAAKKLYSTDALPETKPVKEIKLKIEDNSKQRSISKLEETVNKIKSMREKNATEETKLKKTSLKDSFSADRKSPKVAKKVTFNLETEVREISKEEFDRKRLSLEEYNSRKRKVSITGDYEETKNKIMEDIVTSTEDINDEVVEPVKLLTETVIKETVIKRSPPKKVLSNWEDDTPSPEYPTKHEMISTTNHKCIIDVNEFNIKPIESVSTPSPVSSSQFSYHSEDDSLQVYKDVVDSKLNSLNIKIPKQSKPKHVDRFSVLLDRFLNKGTLNYEELEEVKKFIEIKRKMLEEEKKLTYEVQGERDYKDLKLHFKKVPEKRKKKRFRNLYAEDSSDDSDSSRSDKGVGDYSVYQRDSQGVPKLIFKRKSGLPQPFVKLERSQAVELLAKKRKLY